MQQKITTDNISYLYLTKLESEYLAVTMSETQKVEGL